MRRVRILGKRSAVAATILVLFVIFSGRARASLSDDLKTQIDAKNQEIQKLEEEAKSYRESALAKGKEAQTLKSQIANIDFAIKKLNTDMRLTQAEIDRTRLEIKALGKNIVVEEASIQTARSGLGQLLASMYQSDGEGAFIAIAKYRSLSDFFDAINSMRGVERGIGDKIADLRNLKKQLEDSRSEAQQTQQKLASLLSTLSDQKSMQNDQRKARAILLAETQNQEKRYQQLLDTTEAQREAIQKDIEALESKLRQAVQPGSLPSRGGGVLAWPVEGTVTQGYGQTVFARLTDFYSFHNGIDIRAAIGTPVEASETGVVIATGDSDLYCRRGAYGRYIVIRHNNNLATLYAHLSLIKVSEGEHVERGEIIGYAGMTGLTTGPHLHFTVYDSRTVEIKQSRVCGLLPYGGSVNPLDYLQ